MCQFCVEHADGKAWYHEASTYAYDLESDLKRREYLGDFIRGFGPMRERSLFYMGVLDRLPGPLRRLGQSYVTRSMKPVHFGQPVPLEEFEPILDICTSVVRVPCPCRHFAGSKDEGYCLAITTKPIDAILSEEFKDYDLGPDTSKFETLSREQTMALLRRCEDEGLMHSVWTFLTPYIGAVCNCDLASGCMAMNITVAHGAPVMFKGHSRIEADAGSCTGCARCVKHCPFGALAVDRSSRRVVVDDARCYGCGVCRAVCRDGALQLTPREQPARPSTEVGPAAATA